MYFTFLCVIIMCQLALYSCFDEPDCNKWEYDNKLLYKVIKIEEEVKSFRHALNKMEEEVKRFGQALDQMDVRLTVEQEQKQSLESALQQFQNFQNTSKVEVDEFMKNSARLLTTLEDSIVANLTGRITKLTQRPAIGFSVKNPNGKSSSGNLKFSTIITNTGGGYDQSTGVFTCTVPGYYYIAAMLLKVYSHKSSSYCSIYRNGDQLVIAFTQLSASSNSYTAAVNSIFVHLDKDDTIRLAGCSAVSTLYKYSSFTGFLVTPDPQ